jgi:hypothetical protein
LAKQPFAVLPDRGGKPECVKLRVLRSNAHQDNSGHRVPASKDEIAEILVFCDKKSRFLRRKCDYVSIA